MLNSPCNGCNERYKNCHAHCEDYIEYCKKLETVKQRKQRYNNDEQYAINKTKRLQKYRKPKYWGRKNDNNN